MRILTIPDVHGRTNWISQIGEVTQWDLIIFCGDYVDSFDISPEIIYENLVNIIEFKKTYFDKVILLLGNHDIQYVYENENYECSGYQQHMMISYNILFKEHLGLFQVAYQIGAYIWTHAGIVKSWYNRWVALDANIEGDSIADKLNFMMCSSYYRRLLFQVGYERGGSNLYGGIVWADKKETESDILLGYSQIVGHTPVGDIAITIGGINSNITYTDTRSKSAYILELELEK